MEFPLRLWSPFRQPEPGTPDARALQLFERIATPEEIEQLWKHGGVVVQGKYARYVATSRGGSAVISDSNDVLACGCFGIAELGYYPTLDHFIANYMMFKSPCGERIWWNKVCLTDYSCKLGDMAKKIDDDFQAQKLSMYDRFVGVIRR